LTDADTISEKFEAIKFAAHLIENGELICEKIRRATSGARQAERRYRAAEGSALF
jgi:hypothetical protein